MKPTYSEIAALCRELAVLLHGVLHGRLGPVRASSSDRGRTAQGYPLPLIWPQRRLLVFVKKEKGKE